LELRFQELTTNGAEPVLSAYREVLYKLNQPVSLKKGNILFETTIRGVSETGRLLTKDVIEREFDFGEVEFVIR
ncbi:MAG TPA: biotin--[acetyl-CoA-carboxylase] ligase, partial [Niastella sp.]